MRHRYFIILPDPALAHGDDPELASNAHGAEAFARDVQAALRTPDLFERWRAKQDKPDDVDPKLGEVDSNASATGSQADLVIKLTVDTALPGNILQQRLRWLFGSNWQLRDVTAL